ncbi:hypothetical protein Taro_052553 [Colocasia esculenta]|uniref:Uncharacterized protein n=1 Tax=Colocasia esculenta TaxID=4460 RepID=A0A843XJP9_COLES|nr:hypothetical protein [Colocasia esculenta]
MHDLIHDLAVSVSGGECSAIKNQETWRPTYGSQSLRHIAFVPDSSDVTMIIQSLCCGELSGLRSLLLARRPDVWVKKEVVNEIPDIVVQKLVSLRALDLGYVRLQHLPDSIRSLKHLRYLDLSRTRIEVFPESVCQLYLLQTLDLSYARITGLSDSIKYLTELRYLNLCYSGVRMLPETVGELMNLRTLDLAYTGISNLPQSVGNLRHLTFLDLSGALISKFPEPICLLYSLRTLNLNNVAIEQLPDSIGNLQNLHHLNLNETRIETLPESICDLHLLQVLNLSFSLIRKLPKSIGKLGCLSHLDLSSTPLRRIPKSICRIYNLQSLLLKGSCIQSLPNHMGSLTNLQHLDFNIECVYTPSGVGRLTNLQTLPAFNLGKKPGCCRIQDLRHLTELRGSLQISGLKCVDKPEDADMVDLRAKTQIDKLTLNWEFVQSWEEIKRRWRCQWYRTSSWMSDESVSDSEDSDSTQELQCLTALEAASAKRMTADTTSCCENSVRTASADGKQLCLGGKRTWNRPKDYKGGVRTCILVLEKLQPHSGLKVLQVQGYGGSIFPRWMADPSLPRLVELVLQGCTECSCLPALGQLPSLKQLSIVGASSLEHIGPEFRFSDGGDQGRRGAFPSLEVIKLQHMAKWVKWRGVKSGDFPRLGWLEMGDCPALRGDLPFSSTCSLPMLKVLKISGCPSLAGVSLLNVPNLRTAEFKRCQQLVHIDFGNLLSSSAAVASSSSSSPSSSSSSSWPSMTTSTEMELRSLRIIGCPQARFLQGEGHLLPRTLTYLYIDSQCGCLLDWCLGDGNEWLSQIPYTAVRSEKGNTGSYSFFPRHPLLFLYLLIIL